MPLIFQKEHPDLNCTVAVWKRTEEDQHLFDALGPSPAQQDYISTLNDGKKKEWLCSRLLVKHLIPDENYILYKDAFGKPFLVNSPYFISLSHSDNKAAAIISDRLVGIDIQFETNKLERIHTKFISKEEIDVLDTNHLLSSYHIFWGGKEAMYKAYGKKLLDFRGHMHIYAFKYFRPDLELKGWVRKNNTHQEYDLFTEKLDNFYLVYSVLNPSNMFE